MESIESWRGGCATHVFVRLEVVEESVDVRRVSGPDHVEQWAREHLEQITDLIGVHANSGRLEQPIDFLLALV